MPISLKRKTKSKRFVKIPKKIVKNNTLKKNNSQNNNQNSNNYENINELEETPEPYKYLIHNYKYNENERLARLGWNIKKWKSNFNPNVASTYKNSVTKENHTIYLHIDMHGRVITLPNKSIQFATIPKNMSHVCKIVHGKLGCKNWLYRLECFDNLPYQLSKGLFHNMNETNNTMEKRILKLNEGISSRDFYKVYEKIFLKLQKCNDSDVMHIVSIGKKEIPVLNQSIMKSTDNNYNMYTYNSTTGGNIVLKEYLHNTKKDTLQKGITCLYASGGMFRNKIMENIMVELCGDSFVDFNNMMAGRFDIKSYAIDTTKLLQKLKDLGYTQVYIMDYSCNSTGFAKSLNTPEKIAEFHKQQNAERNSRMLEQYHNLYPTRKPNAPLNIKPIKPIEIPSLRQAEVISYNGFPPSP